MLFWTQYLQNTAVVLHSNYTVMQYFFFISGGGDFYFEKCRDPEVLFNVADETLAQASVTVHLRMDGMHLTSNHILTSPNPFNECLFLQGYKNVIHIVKFSRV